MSFKIAEICSSKHCQLFVFFNVKLFHCNVPIIYLLWMYCNNIVVGNIFFHIWMCSFFKLYETKELVLTAKLLEGKHR